MAGGVSERIIEEVKSRIDLAELIASYGIQVKHAGASQKACCPFHNEKTPSFNINAAQGFYHCFGCGESGDAIKFVQKMEGLTFMEALKKLAGQCGVKIEEKADPDAAQRKRLYALMAELAQFYRRCLLQMKAAEPARAYLAKRELDEKTGDDFLIGYAPEGAAPILKWAEKYGFTAAELEAAGVIKQPNGPGDAVYHRFGGRLMFTVKDRQGRVVAFSGRQLVERKNSGKYVNSPETLIFKKSSVLFGFDRAAGNIARAPHREAIVCEGQIDTIRLHICGFPVAVASQGTAFTEEHARMLRRVADTVVLVFDDDAAGHKATVRVAGMMLALEVPVRVVSLPGGDDPDSFLRTKGAAAFQALLDNAESVMSFQCRSERAKERDPGSIDAVSRISKAVLETVAQCPNAVLRASMLGEASKFLGLPEAALREELEKVREAAAARPARPVTASAPEEPEGGSEEEILDEPFDEGDLGGGAIPGEDAARVEPPPARETAFLAFLMASGGDPEMAASVSELLPDTAFAHDFTRAFLAAWRADAASPDGGSALADFAAACEGPARTFFDAVLNASDRSGATSQTTAEVLHEFVRLLWIDELKRRRGALPASGDGAADVERMRLSTAIKRLNMVKWHTVREMVREFQQEGANQS